MTRLFSVASVDVALLTAPISTVLVARRLPWAPSSPMDHLLQTYRNRHLLFGPLGWSLEDPRLSPAAFLSPARTSLMR